MRKRNASTVLIILLVLVLAALSIVVLRRKSPERPAPDTPSAPPVIVTPGPPIETAAPSAETAESVIETRPPLETETPAPTPDPTPEPTPEPTPIPADAEGSFVSDTGTGLNLRVDWQTYTAADGTRKLKADVSIVSYSIFCSAQYRSITLKLGDESWSADNPGVSYDGKDRIVTPVASFTVDAPAPGTPVTVEWYYGGSYSGKELHTVAATGTVG